MNTISEMEIKKGARRYLLRAIFAPVIMATLFFLAAGTTDLFQAWLFFIMFFLLSLLSNALLYSKNPVLLYHRTKAKPDAKSWDKWLMPIMLIIAFHLQVIVMGLEARYSWHPFSIYLLLTGFVLYVYSFYITTSAMLVNHHFETNVRIQHDRNHQVVSSGPYSIVRHPAYMAFIVATFAGPMIIGSYFGFINAIVGTILLLVRTYKEDNTLKKELAGYAEYAIKVKWKIAPGIW